MPDIDTLRVSPTHDRSKQRVEAILSAAKQHLADVGRDRFAIGAVHKIAGCSVGTVYRYFPDRVALLQAISPEGPSEASTTVVEKVVEVPAELTEEQKNKLSKFDDFEEAIQKLQDWAEKLVAQGEGKGDLKVAGGAILKIMGEKGLL